MVTRKTSSVPEQQNPDEAVAEAGRNQEAIIGLVRALIRQETHQPSQCAVAAETVKRAMLTLGIDVEDHRPEGASGDPLPCLLGWLGPRTATPAVLLCAHLDTSPGGPGWTHDPFGAESVDGIIHGRGAVVSKSDVACFLHAAAAAHRALPDYSILAVVTSDEGSGGGYGAAYLLRDLGLRPRLAIFPGFTDVITIAHNGCVQLKVRVSGTACHQSIVPPGEDAMRRATEICACIYAHADRLATTFAAETVKPTLNITRIDGGTVFGMAPAEVEIWIDRRVGPKETVEGALAELQAIISHRAGESGTTLALETVREAEPMRPVPGQDRFVRILSAESEAVVGFAPPLATSTLYTDARWFSGAGVPTVMFGAGESDISLSRPNGADERVPEKCLRDATAILTRAIIRHLVENDPQ